MSGDFYFLNELNNNQSDEKKVGKDVYLKSDVSYKGSYSIYIRAVQHVISKIEDMISTISSMDRVNQLDSQKHEDITKLRAKFAFDTDNVKKILAEFIKALSTSHDEEGQDTIRKLHHDFTMMDTMVELLFVMKDVKYGNEAIKLGQVLLQVLSHLSEQVSDS